MSVHLSNKIASDREVTKVHGESAMEIAAIFSGLLLPDANRPQLAIARAAAFIAAEKDSQDELAKKFIEGKDRPKSWSQMGRKYK